MTLKAKWSTTPHMKRLEDCPACGADLRQKRPAAHIETHSPVDFGLGESEKEDKHD